MPSTFSPLLRAEEQGDGENEKTWGDKEIATLRLLEKAIVGRLSVSVAGGLDVTLTTNQGAEDQARYRRIDLTGLQTANLNLIVPDTGRWVFFNGATGAFSLTVKTAAGTGIVLPQGGTLPVAADGTNVVPDSPLTADADGYKLAVGSLEVAEDFRLPNAKSLAGRNAADDAWQDLLSISAGDDTTLSSADDFIFANAAGATIATLTELGALSIKDPAIAVNHFSANSSGASVSRTNGLGTALTVGLNDGAANAIGDDIIIDFTAVNSDDTAVDFGRIFCQITDETNGTEDAEFIFFTTQGGATTEICRMADGIIVGTPNGSFKGAGTLNAQNGVYDNNSLLSGYVIEAARFGTIDQNRWGAVGRLGVHVAAEQFAARMHRDLDPDQFHLDMMERGELPAMPTYEEWLKGDLPLGSLVQRLWETAEVMAVHDQKILAEVRALQGRVQFLEAV